MTTIFNDIQAALDSHMASMTGGTPIAWPNVAYKPAAGTTYLKVDYLPGETIQASLGSSGQDITNGIYQVSIVMPRGKGRTTLTDTIADHFSRGSVLSYNGIKLRVRGVSIGPNIYDGAWTIVPVSVSIQSYTEARP